MTAVQSQGQNPSIYYSLYPPSGLYQVTQGGVLIARADNLHAFDRHVFQVGKGMDRPSLCYRTTPTQQYFLPLSFPKQPGKGSNVDKLRGGKTHSPAKEDLADDRVS